MDENTKKKVDETWKELADKEKNVNNAGQGEAEAEIPPADFSSFITSLSVQALMSLGEIENPFTKKKEKDLNQARYIIDTIDMMKEKTKGNLDSEEENLLSTILYELKMKFAQLA